jgi:nitroreductase
MDVFDAIAGRRSIRSYREDPVEPEKLDRLLEAARLAPSARNLQEWRFVVVTDPGTRKKLRAAASDQAFIEEAPVVIACCAETDGRQMACGQASYPIDVAIAMEHIALEAVELGLGTCWVGAFSEPGVKEVLGIPEGVRVVELLPVGYPADPPPARPRKPVAEIVHRERWGG